MDKEKQERLDRMHEDLHDYISAYCQDLRIKEQLEKDIEQDFVRIQNQLAAIENEKAPEQIVEEF